jgi:hypothetical protein
LGESKAISDAPGLVRLELEVSKRLKRDIET